MKNKLILLSSLFLFLLYSCINEGCIDYKLPPTTQTGNNTIGCLVDSMVCIPSTFSVFYFNDIEDFYFNESDGILSLSFWLQARDIDYNCGTYDMQVSLSAENIISCGSYRNFVGVTTIKSSRSGDDKTYVYLDELNAMKGNLVITKLDKANKIISGKFDFEAYYKPGGYFAPYYTGEIDFSQRTSISSGRFDYSFK